MLHWQPVHWTKVGALRPEYLHAASRLPGLDLAPPRMFGYPTGVGALLVRTSVAPLLRKAYWGGGAVALATAGGGGGEGTGVRVPHCRPSERLEDGTVRGAKE